MKDFFKIYQILGSDKKKVYFFLILIFLSAILEIFGIALIIPILTLLLSKNDIIRVTFSNSLFFFDYTFVRSILIIYVTFLILFLYLFKALFLSYFNYWRSNFIFSLNEKFSNKLFQIYLNQNYMFHLNRNSTVNTRNLISIQNFVRNIDQIAHLITEIIIMVSFFILLLFYEPKITLIISFTCLLFAFFYNKKVSPINFRIGKDSHEASQEILQNINQGLFGIKDIKLYGREEEFLFSFKQKIKKFSKSLTIYEFLQPLPKIILEFLAVTLIIFTVLILININYENDKIIIFIALLAAVGFKLIPSFNKIISAVQHLKFYLPITDNLCTELNIKLEKHTKNKPEYIIFKDDIKFSNIKFSYNKEQLILNDLSLEIKKNQKIGIIGSTGAGKTTFINILLGLLKQQNGEIFIDNKKVILSNRSWQNKIGYVPQNVYLIDDTIKKNIAFGINEENISNIKLEKSLKISQLDSFISKLPNGIDTLVGENGVNLSGGQLQRIGIARAIYDNPEILIFDEPTSSLDSETEKKFIKEIYNVSESKTIIIISHKINTLNFCDKIYILKNGKLDPKI